MEGKFPITPRSSQRLHQPCDDESRMGWPHLNVRVDSHERKVRGVRLCVRKRMLSIICNNSEQEEAEDTLPIAYDREALDIAFNIAYILDVLNNLHGKRAGVLWAKPTCLPPCSPVPGADDFKYVVMPMRI